MALNRPFLLFLQIIPPFFTDYSKRDNKKLMERWYGFGVEAHFDQGMKEHNNGNVAQAITHFQECLAISNSHTTRVRARHYLVQCYSILADEFIEQREYEQASILLHKAIRLQPG
jgi:tetratricopeptide (TPR) repeat protein